MAHKANQNREAFEERERRRKANWRARVQRERELAARRSLRAQIRQNGVTAPEAERALKRCATAANKADPEGLIEARANRHSVDAFYFRLWLIVGIIAAVAGIAAAIVSFMK